MAEALRTAKSEPTALPALPAWQLPGAEPWSHARRVPTTAALGLVLLLVVAAHGTLLAVPIARAKGAMEWDPAHHTLWGVVVHQDLAHGRLLSLAFDSYRQIYWPFLHSWMIAASMTIAGPSAYAARTVSIVAFEVTALALGILAWRLFRSRIATVTTVLLWLTSAELLFRFGTEAFTESPAIALTAVAFVALEAALRRPTAGMLRLAGVAAAATYFTKTDYGILAVGATLLVLGLEVRAGRATPRTVRAYAEPIVVLGAAWFAYLPKIRSTFLALQNRPYGPARFSWEGLTFHVGMLDHWTGGGILVALGAAGLALVLWRRPHAVATGIAAYVVVAFALHEWSQCKDEKHITKLVPWTFLLIGHLIALAESAAGRSRAPRLARAALAFVPLLFLTLRLPSTLALPARDGRSGTEAAVDAILARLLEGRSHLVIGEFTELPSYDIDGEILRRHADARVVPDPLTLGPASKDWWLARLEPVRGRLPLLSAVEPAARFQPTIQISHIPSKRDASEPSDPELVRQRFFARAAPDRIFVVVLDPSSPWHRDEYRRYIVAGAPFVPYLTGQGYAISERLRFPGPKLEIVVLDRTPPSGPTAS